jgi:hypothetical protein
MFDRAFGEGETEMKKTIATQTPVGRIGTPEDPIPRYAQVLVSIRLNAGLAF